MLGSHRRGRENPGWFRTGGRASIVLRDSALRRGADRMSEAMLDRAIGGAETLRPTDRLPVPPRHPREVDPEIAVRALPRGDLSEFQRWFRNLFSRTIANVIIRTWFRVEVTGAERFQQGPAVYCFNHLSWLDPLVILAYFPVQPRIYFYGPKEENLRSGKRNRFMWWTGVPIPFSPLKDDLLTSVKWVQAVFDSGGALAISGEGTIHLHEGDLLPFEEGPAYFALRGGVPLVPVAISGTSWVRFRGRIQLRIGDPITTGERPTRQAIAHYRAVVWHAIRAMVDGDRDQPPPSRFSRGLTDIFNDWGSGGRAAAEGLHGPDPADVPIPPSRAA
jgi:1-acyl-sn-glycerol-3-phosphate acyltransferase